LKVKHAYPIEGVLTVMTTYRVKTKFIQTPSTFRTLSQCMPSFCQTVSQMN